MKVAIHHEIPPGKYEADRKLISIEDPRSAEFSDKEKQKVSSFEIHNILRGRPFEITGQFRYRNKTWYTIADRDGNEKPQVINNIVMLNARIKPWDQAKQRK